MNRSIFTVFAKQTLRFFLAESRRSFVPSYAIPRGIGNNYVSSFLLRSSFEEREGDEELHNKHREATVKLNISILVHLRDVPHGLIHEIKRGNY